MKKLTGWMTQPVCIWCFGGLGDALLIVGMLLSIKCYIGDNSSLLINYHNLNFTTGYLSLYLSAEVGLLLLSRLPWDAPLRKAAMSPRLNLRSPRRVIRYALIIPWSAHRRSVLL